MSEEITESRMEYLMALAKFLVSQQSYTTPAMPKVNIEEDQGWKVRKNPLFSYMSVYSIRITNEG